MKHILLVFLLTCTILGASDKEYIIMNSRPAGMFSVWMDVLSLIHGYDQGLYSGIEVDFRTEGKYYDPRYGLNWWEYYCLPIKDGQSSLVRNVKGNAPGTSAFTRLTRQQVKKLIDKYIHIKPEILRIVDNFQSEYFKDYFVISIHFRGTDKFLKESHKITYEKVILNLENVLVDKGLKDYRIFIATDEQPFLDYMIKIYGEKVIFNRDAKRSSNGWPIHVNAEFPYQQGLEAMMDMLLLSRGNYLIRTMSNLSHWSTFFNPDMPVLELNELTDKHKKKLKLYNRL